MLFCKICLCNWSGSYPVRHIISMNQLLPIMIDLWEKMEVKSAKEDHYVMLVEGERRDWKDGYNGLGGNWSRIIPQGRDGPPSRRTELNRTGPQCTVKRATCNWISFEEMIWINVMLQDQACTQELCLLLFENCRLLIVVHCREKLLRMYDIAVLMKY